VSDERLLDVVVFGASGFVGRLIARHLARHAPAEARIGLAGRSEQRLAAVRAELGPRAADWPLVVADSADPGSLAAMAGGARVVATTVGPYRRAGLPLVDACIEAGADYADLTGEVLFVRECMERHDRAAEAGVRIVNSCGFDSIPSDLGVLVLHEAVQADGAGELGDTTLVVTSLKGGASGGTIASVKGQVDDMKASREARKVVADPYALSSNRAAEPEGRDERDHMTIARDATLGQWIAPFVMAPFNSRIVRRSNALQDHAYGRRFRYREVSGLGNGALAPVVGAGMAGGLLALAGGLAIKPSRMLLDRVLPDPGQGPSEKTQENGRFRIEIHTTTTTGAHYVAYVAAQGDPGYKATAVMMGESALCLALDRERLPEAGGVLTPATGIGLPLVDRLRAAGMTFEAGPA
jgi:short subunit dehydrogenase-like uncharacterized protein